MAGDGCVSEAVRAVKAIDQEIGESASGVVAELAVPGGVERDHDFVHDFGKLIAGDIDDDALGFDPGVTLAVEVADSVDVLGLGKAIFAQIVAQQKADLAAGTFGKGGDDEADFRIDLGWVGGANGGTESRGESPQGRDLMRLAHEGRNSIVTGGCGEGKGF